jgi:hypothetical protein
MVATAMVLSIAAYAILFLALSQHRQMTSIEDNVRARMAAEAGIVWAMARLQRDPTVRFAAGATDLPDALGVPYLGGYLVDVFDDCPVLPDPCDTRTLSAVATN